MDFIIGYSYFCFGVLTKGINIHEAKQALDRSYQFLRNTNDLEIIETIQSERYEIGYNDNLESPYMLEHSHLIFNIMICMSDNFKVFLTRLYEIDLPQFTYYQGMSRQPSLPEASRSTSQNVRLYDDTESSPFTPTNHINYPLMGGNRSQSNIKGAKKLDQVPYKYYRQTKIKNQGRSRIRPMTSQNRSQKVIMRSDRSKE